MEASEFFELGYKKQTEKDFKGAIKFYDNAIEKDKNFEKAYIQRAFCNFQLNEFKNALQDYKTGIKLNSKDAVTFLNAGYLTYKLNENIKDVSLLNKAIELDSKNMAEAYFIRGIIYKNSKLYESAIQDFTKAIELNFACKTSLLNRGICHLELKNFDNAFLDFEKAAQLNPINDSDTCFAYLLMGNIKQKEGKNEEALLYYTKAKEIDPNFKI